MVGIGGEALLDRVLGHHVVHGDVLANVANEVQEREVLHPVVVVHEDSVVGRIAVKVEELGELLAYALLVVAQGGLVDEFALLRLHRGVANHARGAAHQSDGTVTCALQVLEHHDAHPLPDVERVGSGVDAHIGRSHFLVELFFSTWHDVSNHASPSKFFYKIKICHL